MPSETWSSFVIDYLVFDIHFIFKSLSFLVKISGFCVYL